MRKLKVSNATNLEMFEIGSPVSVEEIEIEAPGLSTLQILRGDRLIKLELVAPQLNYLDIYDAKLTGGDLTAVISKIDAGPSLSKFCLKNQKDLPCKLQKCEINGAVACRWEAEFRLFNLEEESPRLLYLGEMRRLFARYPQFQTVSINVFGLDKIEEKPVADPTALPATIDHVILRTDMRLKRDQKAMLKAVFWICRPKFFTVTYKASNSKKFFNTLLDLMSSAIWQVQLKEVYLAGDVNEMEMMHISKDMAALLATKKRVCFFLTWSSLVPLTD
ncbi:hypothetical protein LINGRAHAP2_LOCUS30865 [Linum grandiflorum]